VAPPHVSEPYEVAKVAETGHDAKAGHDHNTFKESRRYFDFVVDESSTSTNANCSVTFSRVIRLHFAVRKCLGIWCDTTEHPQSGHSLLAW
jgi:hypothetical protein